MSPLLDHSVWPHPFCHRKRPVSQWGRDIHVDPPARAMSEQHGVVAEGHPQLADGAVDVDAELVGQAQHLAPPEVDQDRPSRRGDRAGSASGAGSAARRGRGWAARKRSGGGGVLGRALRAPGCPGAIRPNRDSSRLSRRPLTATMMSSSSLWPCSCSMRGNTVTSIVASRSSSTNTAIWSPRLGELAAQPGDHAADQHLGAVLELVEVGDRLLSTLRLSAASTPNSG